MVSAGVLLPVDGICSGVPVIDSTDIASRSAGIGHPALPQRLHQPRIAKSGMHGAERWTWERDRRGNSRWTCPAV